MRTAATQLTSVAAAQAAPAALAGRTAGPLWRAHNVTKRERSPP